MYANGYLFNHFRKNVIQDEIFNNYIKNNNLETKRNHITCIYNSFEKKTLKQMFNVFLTFSNIQEKFIIINDIK